MDYGGRADKIEYWGRNPSVSISTFNFAAALRLREKKREKRKEKREKGKGKREKRKGKRGKLQPSSDPLLRRHSVLIDIVLYVLVSTIISYITIACILLALSDTTTV